MRLPDLKVINFDPNSIVEKYTPDDSVPTFWENYSEHIRPIVDSQQKIIDDLTQNYNKLNDLYALKEAELQKAKKGESEAKKYNKKMANIAIWSAIFAGLSLVATVVFGILTLCS